MLHGYDVAILEFAAPIDPSVTRYGQFVPGVDGSAVLCVPGFHSGYGVTGPCAFVSAPASVELCPGGGTAEFSVMAATAVSGPYFFKWSKDGIR